MSNYPDHIVGDVFVVTALIGGCVKKGDEWILPEGKSLPSEEQINAKREELKADYDAKKYQRDRTYAYPSIQDQLDMQYHDQINGTTTWQDAIAKVKADHPKTT